MATSWNKKNHNFGWILALLGGSKVWLALQACPLKIQAHVNGGISDRLCACADTRRVFFPPVAARKLPAGNPVISQEIMIKWNFEN